MALEGRRPAYKIKQMDGGLMSRLPSHMLEDRFTPNAKNFDPSYEGGIKKRKGFTKFTSAAKGAPTGAFVSGLFAATLIDAPAAQVWQVDDDGGPSYVDETTDFNDTDANDVDPFPATEAADDSIMIGSTEEFTELKINTGTVGVGGTVSWEYWNGAWTALTGVVDNTTGFTASGEKTVRWSLPTDWVAVAINGSATLFYVRAKVTGVYSTNPVLTQGKIASGRTYVLASEGTAFHDITAGNWNTTVSGVTINLNSMVRMAAYNDKFLIANEGGGPYKWTGTGAGAALSGSPPANARTVMVHRSRVWFAPNNSTATFSALNSEEDYTTADNAGSVTINKGDGMTINGMISGGDFAVISKIAPSSNGSEGKLYAVFGSSPFDFQVKKIADVGAYSQEAMIAFDNFVVVATARGVYGIQGRQTFKLSDSVDETNEFITGYLDIPSPATVALGKRLSQLKVAYPLTGTTNNQQFVLDIERGVWAIHDGKNARVFANHPDGTLLFGTSSTSILVWNDDTGTNDDSAAINFVWQTLDMDFGDFTAAKVPKVPQIHAKNTGAYLITLKLYKDRASSAETYSDTMNVSTQGPVKRMKQLPNDRAEFWRLELSNNAADQDITVYSIQVTAERLESGTR